MERAGRGQPPELPPLIELVAALIDSQERNRDALLGLTRVRRIGRYTLDHSFNAAVLTIAFARSLGMERPRIAELALGALLHDLGKSLIPEAILNKPGALTDDELALMHGHVLHAHALLRHAPGMPEAALVLIAEHHERIDGSGYPRGRRGKQISRQGRMAAIVDVYDAISADRVYQTGLEPHLALRKLLEWSRFHFDADLVQRFIRCLGIYPVGSLVRLESGLLGVVVRSGRKGPLQPVVRVFMNATQRRNLKMHDLDLSAPGIGDRISGIESPVHWRIRPEVVLLHTLG
nr:HD-GYP domain-containing protein [Marichromatium bheemlicum]